MTVLVLGGAGFIGRAVVRLLSDAGQPARVLDRNRCPDPVLADRPEIEWHLGELGDRAALERALVGVATVVHLASGASPAIAQTDWEADVQSQVIDSIGLLRCMGAADVRRLVYLSSGGTVYGVTNRVPIDELQPAAPLLAYGINKLAVEHFIALAHRSLRIDSVVLRAANAYGPGQRTDRRQGLVGTAIRCALSRRPLPIWGDGSTVRDFVYVDDVARAILAAIRYRGTHTTFNIGSGVGRSIREVVADIERLSGIDVSVEYLPLRGLDVPFNVLDCRRARTEMGWEPLVSFEQGLSTTLAWFRTVL
jgi:UDP-glucose 4-epimerase